MFCCWVLVERETFEEFNPAPKVNRTPQGTNPASPRDHRFWRRRKFSPARANNPQAGWEPSKTQSHNSLRFVSIPCSSDAPRHTPQQLLTYRRTDLVDKPVRKQDADIAQPKLGISPPKDAKHVLSNVEGPQRSENNNKQFSRSFIFSFRTSRALHLGESQVPWSIISPPCYVEQ